MKREKQHRIYIYQCPVCGKTITSLYLTQALYNAAQHLHRHGIKRKLSKEDLTVIEL